VLDERERIQAALHAAGIPTAVHYPVPMHLQPAYAHLCSAGQCPVAVEMAGKVLSLPMGPYMAAESVHEVAAVVLQALGEPLPEQAELAGVPQ
jgi:UDP-2-acetamido-2-deoxy-ribo-hexuluronate aminotransferase